MERDFIAKIAIDEDVATMFLDTNGEDVSLAGTGEFLEREFGWLNESGIFLKEYLITDNDDEVRWSRYINYLIEWAMEHSSIEYDGMSPVCYDEWCDNEDSDI
jgi:hypothetical protein